MTASLRRASLGVSRRSPSSAFHAPLFHDLVAGLGANERHVVLDLGTASTSMLALLGRCRCRVDIADLAYFGGVDRLNSAKPGAELAKVGESLLPKRLSDEAVDLVFCWDLPNYLSLNALSALMVAVGQRARPGALVHALISYADRDMNEYPGRYIPNPAGELVDHNATRRTVTAPRYSPEDLGKNMGRFVIDRARLLSNGLQEFLFRLQS